jgi:hypothetical protein
MHSQNYSCKTTHINITTCIYNGEENDYNRQ